MSCCLDFMPLNKTPSEQEETALHLAQMLQKNVTLKSLMMQKVRKFSLPIACSRSPSYHVTGVQHEIGDFGMERLCFALNHNRSLLRLDLARYDRVLFEVCLKFTGGLFAVTESGQMVARPSVNFLRTTAVYNRSISVPIGY